MIDYSLAAAGSLSFERCLHIRFLSSFIYPSCLNLDLFATTHPTVFPCFNSFSRHVCLWQMDLWKYSFDPYHREHLFPQVLPSALSVWREMWHHAGGWKQRALPLKCNSFNTSCQCSGRHSTSTANECVKNLKIEFLSLEGRAVTACTFAAGWQNERWVNFSRRIWHLRKLFSHAKLSRHHA